ncbi:MAG: spore cortex biosynthesis protein YabQ [Ruminococcus sp.]|nr:spore cortex biosynthesis protein YabQ [Ruminococcus sp.]
MENMQLGLELETELYLLAVIIGFAMGGVYDLFRMMRVVFKSAKVFTFICDLIYTLLFWFVLFTFCTGLTGQIRVFALTGMLIGALMERVSIGNAVVRLFSRVWKWLSEKVFKPLGRFMTKSAGKIKRVFVKNSLNYQKDEKNEKNHLKVEL